MTNFLQFTNVKGPRKLILKKNKHVIFLVILENSKFLSCKRFEHKSSILGEAHNETHEFSLNILQAPQTSNLSHQPLKLLKSKHLTQFNEN